MGRAGSFLLGEVDLRVRFEKGVGRRAAGGRVRGLKPEHWQTRFPGSYYLNSAGGGSHVDGRQPALSRFPVRRHCHPLDPHVSEVRLAVAQHIAKTHLAFVQFQVEGSPLTSTEDAALTEHAPRELRFLGRIPRLSVIFGLSLPYPSLQDFYDLDIGYISRFLSFLNL